MSQADLSRKAYAARHGSFPGETERDILFTREEAAHYLRCSHQSLELWQRAGTGPKVVRIGRQIRYRLSDLRAYVEEQVEGIA